MRQALIRKPPFARLVDIPSRGGPPVLRLRFLGGGDEVGRNALYAEANGTRLLFDYGTMPSDPPKYPEQAPAIDAAILSHAHLDHCGMMPWVASQRPAPIYTTTLSQPIAELLARDSLKVCKSEGYPFPFTHGAIRDMCDAFQEVHYGERDGVEGVDLSFSDAGHIPGSAQVKVEGAEKTLVFTGDLNLIETNLCNPAKPVKCDVLVIEATYSGRNHPPRQETIDAFLDAVSSVVAQGGHVIVPSFATGRTQEMLCILADQGYTVALDGMGKAVTEMMLASPRYLKSPRILQKAFEKVNVVKNPAQRERAHEADVIVTTSGMVEGGPVLHYIEKLRKDPRNAIFCTGYQVPGSGGRRLMETGQVEVAGVLEKVDCEVRFFNFSAHAGHDDLVEFIRATGAEDVVLFHSDKREALGDAISAFTKPHLPRNGDWMEF